MSLTPVSVSTLPGDDISPDSIDTHAAALFRAGAKVAARGERVNADWKKLSASYGAPETEGLVAKMGPVEKAAARFEHRTAKVTSALEAFADEARAIKVRAEAIRARGNAFLNGVVAHGIEKKTVHGKYNTVATEHLRWDQDDAAVAENNAILAEIKQLADDLEAAEAACANAITTAVHAEPVMGGTSTDWAALPAGTQTPWGTEYAQRSENNEEATNRGILTGAIGMVTSLMALGAWQNKTLTYENVKNGTFDPLATRHSFAVQGEALLGIAKLGLGTAVISSPLAPLTLMNLKSNNWLGSFSRATSGSVIDAGKSFAAYDRWKSDPYAARGEVAFNVVTLLIPGAGEVKPFQVGARVAVRASEDAAGAAARVGSEAGSGASRLGADAAADAARNGLSRLPGAGLEVRTGLGHAGEAAGMDLRVGAGGKKLTTAADDFSLERGPAVSDAPAARTPPTPVPERVRPPTLREPAAARFPDSIAHQNETVRGHTMDDAGTSAKNRIGVGSRDERSVLERELVPTAESERPVAHGQPQYNHVGNALGGDLAQDTRRSVLDERTKLANGTSAEHNAAPNAPAATIPDPAVAWDNAAGQGSALEHSGAPDSMLTPGYGEHVHADLSADHYSSLLDEGARRRPRDLLDVTQQDPWAREVYDELVTDSAASDKFGNSLSGVERPSGRIGFNREEIAQVLHHLLKQEHDLRDYDTGRIVSRRFDPSAEIAAALLRIREGKVRPNDVLLVEHELAELRYMRSTGADYASAHAFANEKFNWEQTLEGGG